MANDVCLWSGVHYKVKLNEWNVDNPLITLISILGPKRKHYFCTTDGATWYKPTTWLLYVQFRQYTRQPNEGFRMNRPLTRTARKAVEHAMKLDTAEIRNRTRMQQEIEYVQQLSSEITQQYTELQEIEQKLTAEITA